MDNFAPIHDVYDDLWDRVFRISLRGSSAGAAYTASKHAVVGLTKNSALMYGPKGMRFDAVAPAPPSPTSWPTGVPSSRPNASAR